MLYKNIQPLTQKPHWFFLISSPEINKTIPLHKKVYIQSCVVVAFYSIVAPDCLPTGKYWIIYVIPMPWRCKKYVCIHWPEEILKYAVSEKKFFLSVIGR